MLCMQSQDMRFANGTTGRLLWWAPGNIDDKKSLPSSHPELLVPSRLCKSCLLGRRASLPHKSVASTHLIRRWLSPCVFIRSRAL